SQFVAESCARDTALWADLVAGETLGTTVNREDFYTQALAAYTVTSEAELMVLLRRFRRCEMVRIAWRDIAGWASVEETLSDLSALADACVQYALDFLHVQATQQWGVPVLSNGKEQRLVVLAMGKLGGEELNFSSDIDLIYCYAESGELTAGKKHLDYSDFFSRLAKKLTRVLSDITVDGFVYRVDTRLRPFGASGPWVMSFLGLENYYYTQAREWERYAMVKARVIADDADVGELLMETLNRFVYRRYLDYGAFEELRRIKYKIKEKLVEKGKVDNIKLGVGGIREIEFVVQSFQLIRGGTDIYLQHRQLLIILDRLKTTELLPEQDVEILRAAYLFLRKTENRLQQYRDEQVHDLPQTSQRKFLLAYSMGFDNWETFLVALDRHRQQVSGIFEQLFSRPDEKKSKGLSLWVGIADDDILITDWLALGYRDAENLLVRVKKLRESAVVRRLTTKGAETLDRLVPLVIEQTGQVMNQDETLIRLLGLLSKVAGRNVYFALLIENPKALTHLIKLTAASPWIGQQMAAYPVLFDELLDGRTLYEPLSKDKLNADLALVRAKNKGNDTETFMNELRRFKQINMLRVAVAGIMDVIPVMVVSDYLTALAEVVLQQVVHSAWHLLGQKYGRPKGCDFESSGFAVIGLGKLGGYELGYGSDLDMVFLYHSVDEGALTDGLRPISTVEFYVRLGQKILFLLNSKLLSGILYQSDMRLRPNGDSGLLVVSVQGYAIYQQENAWTWEHQALVRGRFVAGDQSVGARFDTIRENILSQPRDFSVLKKEVLAMRLKMRDHFLKPNDTSFHLKHGTGGIVDIEFIVQFYVLAYAESNLELVSFTDNIRLLQLLHEKGVLSKRDADILQRAYCEYRIKSHQQVLQERAVAVDSRCIVELRSQVQSVWHAIMD
ncbi:MAG: bifunctional [glutamate--ammonia ligase]-adenylyl-L-tyrosine phosphorylase/[glutamate--ammonia-ligase] adenylyltransferase, partial [Methylococcales bacterium]